MLDRRVVGYFSNALEHTQLVRVLVVVFVSGLQPDLGLCIRRTPLRRGWFIMGISAKRYSTNNRVHRPMPVAERLRRFYRLRTVFFPNPRHPAAPSGTSACLEPT